MAITMNFTILHASGVTEPVTVEIRKMINAGYTGRDQKAVQAHIDQLKEEGIPAPDKAPTYFPKFADRLTQAESFEVLDESDHSGEAEFALIFHQGRVLVGVGSDHTDRRLETVDIPKAKQLYPNTISLELWVLDEIKEEWDRICLKSWVEADGGARILFQEATLAAILPPGDLIERVRKLLVDPDDVEGLVIYSGTVAALVKTGYSRTFETALEDPVLNRRLSQRYSLNPVSGWRRN
jgi:hypothetical protein